MPKLCCKDSITWKRLRDKKARVKVANIKGTGQSQYASNHQLAWGSLVALQIKNWVTSTTHNHVKGNIELINVDAKQAGWLPPEKSNTGIAPTTIIVTPTGPGTVTRIIAVATMPSPHDQLRLAIT
jgi:hypothetical protein